MDLNRRRLCWRLRRRPSRPVVGEGAVIDKHTALETIQREPTTYRSPG